jgi:hypothetical protein
VSTVLKAITASCAMNTGQASGAMRAAESRQPAPAPGAAGSGPVLKRRPRARGQCAGRAAWPAAGG